MSTKSSKKGNPFSLPKVQFLEPDDESFCENCLKALELHDKGFPEAYKLHCYGRNQVCSCSCKNWKK